MQNLHDSCAPNLKKCNEPKKGTLYNVSSFRLPSLSTMDSFTSVASITSNDKEKSDSSTDTCRKIEMAINQLNMDEYSISELKRAFLANQEDQHGDVANALMTLQKNATKKPLHIPRPLPVRPRPERTDRKDNSPYFVPTRTTPELVNCQIFTRIQFAEHCWEIFGFCPSLDGSCYRVSLVKLPGAKFNNAVCIQGLAVVTFSAFTGVLKERKLFGRTVVPLRNICEVQISAIYEMRNGRIRITVIPK